MACTGSTGPRCQAETVRCPSLLAPRSAGTQSPASDPAARRTDGSGREVRLPGRVDLTPVLRQGAYNPTCWPRLPNSNGNGSSRGSRQAWPGPRPRESDLDGLNGPSQKRSWLRSGTSASARQRPSSVSLPPRPTAGCSRKSPRKRADFRQEMHQNTGFLWRVGAFDLGNCLMGRVASRHWVYKSSDPGGPNGNPGLIAGSP